MNATPVTMLVEGNLTPIGFACSQCFKVARIKGNELERQYGAEEAANDCCACSRCGAYRGPVGEEGRYFNLCRACTWWSDFGDEWQRIGYCVSLGLKHRVLWLIVQHQLDYGEHMDELYALARGESAADGCRKVGG